MLRESRKYGTLELANIENLILQAEMVRLGRLQNAEAESVKPYGVVAVAAGNGMQELFRELGADRIVIGGQTMNPSTDDILYEINLTPAEVVFVLPNNKNIIMAAEAAAGLCKSKRVIVIPTRTMPQGISALMSLNTDEEEELLVKSMKEAATNVHTAMVTCAARDSVFDGQEIHEGENLALVDGAFLGSYISEKAMLDELACAFVEFSPECITVYYGQNVNEQDAGNAAAVISVKFPDALISVVNGGQPVYSYMISAE